LKLEEEKKQRDLIKRRNEKSKRRRIEKVIIIAFRIIIKIIGRKIKKNDWIRWEKKKNFWRYSSRENQIKRRIKEIKRFETRIN